MRTVTIQRPVVDLKATGKSIPIIDNLLVLAHLFEKSVDEIVIQRMIEIEVSCVSDKIEKLCNKNCDDCKLRLSA